MNIGAKFSIARTWSLAFAVEGADALFSLLGAATDDAGDDYSLTLDQTQGTPLSAWTINWGDGETDTLPGGDTTPTHTYAAVTTPTTYTITASGAGASGSVDAANSLSVTVDPPAPEPQIDGDGEVDPGDTYTLSLDAGDSPGGEVSSWTIDWGDGSAPQTVAGDATSVTHVFPSGVNSYTISATATNAYGSWDAEPVSVDVGEPGPTLNGSPELKFAENGDGSLDLSAFFTDSTEDSADLTYSLVSQSDTSVATAWLAGDMLSAGGKPDQYGANFVVVEVTDSSGLVTDATIPVIVTPVNQPPTVVADIPDQALNDPTTPTLVDLWNYFSDPEDKTYLTYTISSDSDPAIFAGGGPSVGDGFLSLLCSGVGATATLTITATDRDGLSVTSDPFTVTAYAEPLPIVAAAPVAGYDGFSYSGPAVTLGASNESFFMLARSGGDLGASLTANYSIGYTLQAENGNNVPVAGATGSVTFGAGQTEVKVPVAPPSVGDINGYPPQGGIATITIDGGGDDYTAGASGNIPVLAGDDVEGTYPYVLVGYASDGVLGGQPGELVIERSATHISQPLSINYTLGSGYFTVGVGYAPPGLAYSGAYGTLTFAAGQSQIDIPIADDGVFDDDAQVENVDINILGPQLPSMPNYYVLAGESPSGGDSYSLGQAGVALWPPTPTPPPDEVSASFEENSTPVTDAYVPIDQSYDEGETAQQTVSTDGVSYQALVPVPDNKLDRQLNNAQPALGDDEAISLTINNVDGSPSELGTVTFNAPGNVIAWVYLDDRWAPAGTLYNVVSGQTVQLEVQGIAPGDGELTAIFVPKTGGPDATASVELHVFGIDVAINSATEFVDGVVAADLTADDYYYLGYTDADGDPIADDDPSETQYPTGDDPYLYTAQITPVGDVLPGSTFTVTVPDNVRMWDIATQRPIYTGESFPANAPLDALVQAVAAADPPVMLVAQLAVTPPDENPVTAADGKKEAAKQVIHPPIFIAGNSIKLGQQSPDNIENTKNMNARIIALAGQAWVGAEVLDFSIAEEPATFFGISGVIVLRKAEGDHITYGIFAYSLLNSEWPKSDLGIHQETYTYNGVDVTISANVQEHENWHILGPGPPLAAIKQQLTDKGKASDKAYIEKYLTFSGGIKKGTQDAAKAANEAMAYVAASYANNGITAAEANALIARYTGVYVTSENAKDTMIGYGAFHLDRDDDTLVLPWNPDPPRVAVHGFYRLWGAA